LHPALACHLFVSRRCTRPTARGPCRCAGAARPPPHPPCTHCGAAGDDMLVAWRGGGGGGGGGREYGVAHWVSVGCWCARGGFFGAVRQNRRRRPHSPSATLLPRCEALLGKSDPISRQLLVSRAIEGIWLALAYGYRFGDRQTESHPVQIWRWLWLNAPRYGSMGSR